MQRFMTLLAITVLNVSACAQTAMSGNQPFPTTIPAGIPTGRTVYGAFEGRIPCKEISKQLNVATSDACTKRKISILLYQDPATQSPTTFKVSGLGTAVGDGQWHILKGMPGNANAVVYQLDIGKEKLYLFKGDDNVLFVLDKDKNFLLGNAEFSYTLNRVRTKQPGDDWHVLVNKG